MRLDLEFDGTEFLGWQRQPEGRTVQAVVEEALQQILGTPHRVMGAGRTDTGAHARGMVASFGTAHTMPAATLQRALNAVLPPDVGVRAVGDAPPGFHALRDAWWKWYRYSLLTGALRRPLLRRRTWHVHGTLDRAALEAGAQALVGRHDFRAFANTGSPRRTTIRTLFDARWTPDPVESAVLHFDVVGDGFLYRMVRALVGTLVQRARSGSHGFASAGPQAARAAFERLLASGDRSAAGPVAPARGLCLMASGVGSEPPPGRLPPFLLRAVESARRPTSGGHP